MVSLNTAIHFYQLKMTKTEAGENLFFGILLLYFVTNILFSKIFQEFLRLKSWKACHGTWNTSWFTSSTNPWAGLRVARLRDIFWTPCTMTKLQWLILWLIFLGYLFLGAFIFYQIERKLEESQYAQELKDIEDPSNKIQGERSMGLYE